MQLMKMRFSGEWRSCREVDSSKNKHLKSDHVILFLFLMFYQRMNRPLCFFGDNMYCKHAPQTHTVHSEGNLSQKTPNNKTRGTPINSEQCSEVLSSAHPLFVPALCTDVQAQVDLTSSVTSSYCTCHTITDRFKE